jgi:hypothetical protein
MYRKVKYYSGNTLVTHNPINELQNYQCLISSLVRKMKEARHDIFNTIPHITVQLNASNLLAEI